MDGYTVADVVRELDISKSYLYKIIDTQGVLLPKTKTGRYVWNDESIHQIKRVLGKEDAVEARNEVLLAELGLKQSFINNRRFLGNKYSLTDFIRRTVEENCQGVNIVADLFSGTGAVANAFRDKMLITNDLLYSNYISNYAWLFPEEYDGEKIIRIIYAYNILRTQEDNYMRQNFADTFFSADDCSKIGFIREDIEEKYKKDEINFKEYAILITALLYGMDKIANTVGHYDAYRQNTSFDRELVLNVLLPNSNLNANNVCFNEDIAVLVKDITCDLLYLDPPYNSRQYCDAYHLLENVARWEKPEVYGVARKMDRGALKSDYCMNNATAAFEKLIEAANTKYILLSYNNMQTKGNDRSNAKISDEDIFRILGKKGKVTVFEESYKTFSTGKSHIANHKERLFLCEVQDKHKNSVDIACPFNYIGGKFRLLKQLKPLFKDAPIFLDLFSGGGNVGINSDSSKVIFNDSNEKLIGLMEYIRRVPTEQMLKRLDNIIGEYGLSNTSLYGYAYYGCDSSRGLAAYNRNGFLRLRDAYNTSVKGNTENFALLYVLMVFSFNNQIRFNGKGEFNLPVGKRDFNAKMRSKLVLFSEELKRRDIHFLRRDFRDVRIDELPTGTFIYCDPPYLITDATYNENGMWTEVEEMALLEFLDTAAGKGFFFALSNVLESKGQKNTILTEWIKKRGYKCHFLDRNYANSNYHRKGKGSVSVEVLVTNYEV